MRAKNDMLGCANRMRKTASEFREAVAIVLEHWRDDRAARFQREDLRDIDQVIDQLTIQLQQSSELVTKLDRQLRDEEEV